MRCIDSEHLKALLHLYDMVDFNSKTIKNFDILKFLMAILAKKNLAENLRHPIEQEEHDIVDEFLSNTTHPVLISLALSSFKKTIENGDKAIIDDLLIDLSVLSDIQLKYFENEKNKFSEDGITLFYNCVSKTNSLFFRTKVFDIMKKEIIKNPEEYFRTFIGKGETSNSEFNTLYPKISCSAIFGSYDEFENFLNSFKNDSQYVIRVKNFWQLYKNNGYKPIEFDGQGNVQEKIDNCFINEIKLLWQLKYIKNYLNRGGKINDKLKRLFENNNLYIKLRGDIYKMMEN